MKKTLIGIGTFLLFSFAAGAAIVAVVDSGTDVEHDDLRSQIWKNPGEIEDNREDDDGNGFIDDIFGWNFAENNNILLDRKYIGYLTDEIRRFFRVQTEALRGTVSPADLEWARAKIKEEAFLKKLITYGTFMHGSHVGGIVLQGDPDAELLVVKLIPTPVLEIVPGMLPLADFTDGKDEGEAFGGAILIKGLLYMMAKRQMDSLTKVVQYFAAHKAAVANFSFGLSYPLAKKIVTQIAKQFGQELTEKETEELSLGLLNTLIEEGKKMAAAAPDTLIVVASGNDGMDNDTYPNSPANIPADNIMSVAATLDRTKLARFSNFGAKQVDIAAPGVGIYSTVPGNEYLTSSGTSQAAPLVAGIASKMKDANPALAPKELKELLMKTSTPHAFLQGKVASGGIVNGERALVAAGLSLEMGIGEAAAASFLRVPDGYTPKSAAAPFVSGAEDLILPLPGSFTLLR